MVVTSDLAHQRLLLTTLRTQFSSNTQRLKQDGIDRIVRNILYLRKDSDPLNIVGIRIIFKSDQPGANLSYKDVEGAIDRLIASGDVEEAAKSRGKRFRLTNQARELVAAQTAESDRIIDRVVEQLFSSDHRGWQAYKEVFLDLLVKVHVQLGEENARIITGQLNGFADKISAPIIEKVKSGNGKYSHLNHDLIESAIQEIASSSDPRYREIFYYMAQNYFVMKMLGLDPSGSLLSKELFEESTFFFDTNTVISLLDPYDEHHDLLVSLVEALDSLGATLHVSAATIAELDRWCAYHRSLFKKVIDDIPESLMPQVHSPFVARYKDAKERGVEPTIDYIFESFRTPAISLSEKLNITVVHDAWFYDSQTNKEVKDAAAILKKLRQRKSDNVAIHDAQVMLWVKRLRVQENQRAWLVTQDRSLPGAWFGRDYRNSLAITVDALLQWVSPIASGVANEEVFSSGFARLWRDQILPRERYFVLDDFRIFDDLNIQTGNLPPGEVAACLTLVKQSLGTMNMNSAEDRERLYQAMSRYFHGPDAMYQQELKRLAKESEEAQHAHDKQLADQEREHAKEIAERDRLIAHSLQEAAQARKDKEDYESSVREGQRRQHRKTMKTRGYTGWTVLTVLWLALEGTAVYLILNYIGGDSRFLKLAVNIGVLALIAGFYRSMAHALLGDEKLWAMGGFFGRLYGADPGAKI